MGNVWDIKGRYKAAMNNEIRGDRGVFNGGKDPGYSNIIDYISISSTGDAADFGDLSFADNEQGTVASHVRAVYGGGYQAPGAADTPHDNMSYVTFASKGNAAAFGDVTAARKAPSHCIGNNTRGLVAGGWTGSARSNVIDHTTIASIGTSTDFGNLTAARSGPAGLSSPTRGVIAGGYGPGYSNVIDYVTIASTGDAVDFGDLLEVNQECRGLSSATRGVVAGGQEPSGVLNRIQYLTIATLGNTADFGDLTDARSYAAAASNATRGAHAGGADPSNSNIIDYYQIATTGNATDFGDLTQARTQAGGCSNGHGGLEVGIIQRPELGGHPDRAAFGGGFSPGQVDIIDSIQIMSTGNGADFGNLTAARGQTTGFASNTRGITYGGDTDSNVNTESNIIDYITIATAGDASDFGDTSVARRFLGAGSNDTRGFGGGGYTPSRSDVIDYITIATTGNASDFGDMLTATSLPSNFVGSSTRGVTAGGQHTGTPGGGVTNDVIQYITIASTGNANDFGDLIAAAYSPGGASNKTRGLFAGGGGPNKKTIDYITIASTGNGADFGDLTGNRLYMGSTSNTTRAVFGVGQTPSLTLTADYVYPAVLGNAVDFGDLTDARTAPSAMCGSHGGI